MKLFRPLLVAFALLLAPSAAAAAIATPWNATSTGTGFISPNLINGISPYLKIDGTGTSTFAAGINLSGGCFAINGVCISGSGGSGTVTNIATIYPVLGGPITTTGTLSLAFGTTTQNVWGAYNSFTSLFATLASTTNATTTNLHITSIASKILATDANGRVVGAVAGTDYAAPTSGSSLLYGNGAGGFSNATVGTGLSFVGGTLSATGIATNALGTTSPWTGSGLAWRVSDSSVSTVATTTLTITGPFNVPSTLGTLVGGSGSVGYWGLATTSQPSSSNILTSNGAAGVYGTATSTLSLGIGLSGTVVTVGSGQTLSVATSSFYSGTTGQIPYFSGTNTLTATSSIFLSVNGYLGVGTTSPVNPLWVENSVSVPATFYRNTSASNVSIELKNNSGSFFMGKGAGGNFNINTNSNISTSPFIALTTAGLFGIGTSSPFAQLSVSRATQSSATTELFTVASTTNATLFTILGNGNVGIGATTTPYAPLTVVQSGGLLTPALIVDGVEANSSAEIALNRSTSASKEANIDFNSGGVEKWQLGMQDRNPASDDFEFWDGLDNPIWAVSAANNDFMIGTTTGFAELTIWGDAGTGAMVNVVTAASTTAFTVLNNGNVGIGGTTSPAFPLTILQGPGVNTVGLQIDGIAAGATGGAEMALNRDAAAGAEANIDFNTNSVEKWQLGMQNNSTDDFELWDGLDNAIFTISQSTKNVGIGTTTPFSLLSVSTTTAGNAASSLFAIASNTNATLLNVLGNGNVGIGTSSPGTLFSIQGVANFRAATSTFISTGGVNITAGCFALNGVCLSTGGGATPGGTGTEVQYRSGASIFGAIVNSAYNAAADFLGFGTTTPKWQVEIASSSPQLTLTDPTSGGTHWSLFNKLGDLWLATSSPTTFGTTTSPFAYRGYLKFPSNGSCIGCSDIVFNGGINLTNGMYVSATSTTVANTVVDTYTAPPGRRAFLITTALENKSAGAILYQTSIRISGTNYYLTASSSAGANGNTGTQTNEPMVVEPGETLSILSNTSGGQAYLNLIEYDATTPFYSPRILNLNGTTTLYTVPTGASAMITTVNISSVFGPGGNGLCANTSGSTLFYYVFRVKSGQVATHGVAGNVVPNLNSTFTSCANNSFTSVVNVQPTGVATLNAGDSVVMATIGSGGAGTLNYLTVYEH